ncbi:MAG: family 16 glycoside hydrolase [Planctomycetota bacterium]
MIQQRVTRVLLAVLLLATAVAAQAGERPVRVACVGDSITFGAGIQNRKKNSYPAQLGRRLGEGYEARNFGVNGATLLKKGDKPYWQQKAFRQATQWQPDIVLIKLGTNDSKPQNWRHKGEFADDLRAMVEHFAALPSKPTVWLCLPVPVYATRWGINEQTVKGEIIPIIEKVAEEKGLPTIDLYAALSGHPDLFPDKIHPNAQGAALMATTIAGALRSEGWTSLFNGKDLSGWVVKCRPVDRDKTFWTVDDGTILADSMDSKKHGYVWLCTEKEYGDFVLRLKFQAYRDSPGNSGVQIRSRYDPEASYLDGPQIDIHPRGPWRTGMVWDETRGNQRWLYPQVPKGKWVNKSMAAEGLRFFYSDQDDGWNSLEITADGMQLQAALNGVTVMEYDGDGVLNDKTHQRRRVGQRGVIALQIHKGDRLRIRFKDLEIREP